MKTRIYTTPAVKGLSSPQHQPQSTQDVGAMLFHLGPLEYQQQSSYKYDKGPVYVDILFSRQCPLFLDVTVIS